MFFLLYRHADDGVFDDFPKISDHLPKISEDFPKLFRRPDERFRTFSENSRRCPKIAEDCRRLSRKTRRCFDDTPTNLSTFKRQTKAKGGNRDVIERYDTHKDTPLGSRMKWRMESTSGLVPSKTLLSI